ncbi:hypothetical protein HUU53_01375 [Candidatus Micrarchaeota archaeon]|nr:hypothetical protein [Candidatus Micrarchaeota archaeon]
MKDRFSFRKVVAVGSVLTTLALGVFGHRAYVDHVNNLNNSRAKVTFSFSYHERASDADQAVQKINELNPSVVVLESIGREEVHRDIESKFGTNNFETHYPAYAHHPFLGRVLKTAENSGSKIFFIERYSQKEFDQLNSMDKQVRELNNHASSHLVDGNLSRAIELFKNSLVLESKRDRYREDYLKSAFSSLGSDLIKRYPDLKGQKMSVLVCFGSAHYAKLHEHASQSGFSGVSIFPKEIVSEPAAEIISTLAYSPSKNPNKEELAKALLHRASLSYLANQGLSNSLASKVASAKLSELDYSGLEQLVSGGFNPSVKLASWPKTHSEAVNFLKQKGIASNE